MRYRALSSTGDYTFGGGNNNFLIDQPATVGQAVQTRLKLLTNEWFLDVTEGTPYSTEVLGEHTAETYDSVIRDRILTTDGVTDIADYSSIRDPITRQLTVSATIDTIFGRTEFEVAL